VTLLGPLLKNLQLRWSDLSSLNDTVQREIDKAQIFLRVAQEAK
jgi:hypothetical protein